jgi:DNA-binding NarL/FixJ family response regulator
MSSSKSAPRIRVAIADDHFFVRAGMRRFIGSFDDLHFVGQAGSAEETLELVQAAAIDVLLLDVNMPDRSGLEILPQLRAIAPRMQVLVVSALAAAVVAGPALSAGAFAYLEKPVHPGTLERTIREAAAVPSAAANEDRFDRGG